MTVKSGQAIAAVFCTLDSTGALSALTGGTASLYQQGTVTATVLAITGSNPYKWAGTAPVLTAGDIVQTYVAGTVSAVATGGFVWGDIADTKLTSDLNDAAAAPSASTVASQVRTELTTELARIDAAITTRAGTSVWTDIKAGYLDATVSSRSTYAGGAVASVTGNVDGNVTGSVASVVALGTANIGTAVWQYGGGRTVTAGTVSTTATVAISSATAASVATGDMGMRTHHTFSQAITSTSTQDLSGATKLWYAVKASAADADAASIVMMEKTAGLQYLLGATAGTATAGTITVTGTTGAWSITPKLSAAAEGLLTAYIGAALPSEVKALVGTDTVAVWDGETAFSRGIVQATS